MILKNIVNWNFVISLFLCLICLIGDKLVDISNSKVSKAIFDNLTHNMIGVLSAFLIVEEFSDKFCVNEKLLIILCCGFISSFIDVDHFVQAKSWKLKDATNLTTRPFLHCSSIPLIIFICLIIATYFKSLRLNVWLSVIFCAFTTHHIRDATRRGFWILPYGHTKPINYSLYILLTATIPHFIIYFLNRFKYNIYKLNINQSIDV